MLPTANGQQLWLVSLSEGTPWPQDTHAGGAETKILPEFEAPPLAHLEEEFVDGPVRRIINPRRVLTLSDRLLIQETFPGCVGARLLVCGFLVVLFENTRDMKVCWNLGVPSSFGLLRVVDTPTYEPTTVTAGYGQATGSAPRSCNNACRGLRLRLPSGESVITTVTHAYVKLRPPAQSKTVLKLTDMYIRLKESLMQQRPAPILPVAVVGGFAIKPKNSPLGQIVWLAGTENQVSTRGSTKKKIEQVGTITISYDHSPSEALTFPHGFVHGLSLITSPNSPILASPPGFPLITEWAPYVEVLDGASAFVTRLDVRDISGHIMSTQEQQAVIAGTEYKWTRRAISRNISLIWRTSTYDADSAQGFSGSVLCLGHKTKSTAAKAVVFQNYQSPLKLKGVKLPKHAVFRGGFLLPTEIRRASIDKALGPQRQNFLSAQGRHKGAAEGKRTVSSPIQSK